MITVILLIFYKKMIKITYRISRERNEIIMNKQKLAAKIWESANQMRSKIEANEYKDYILGFIFYKYLSDKELTFLRKEGYDDDSLKSLKEDDIEAVDHIKSNIGYFIAYDHLFSTWIKSGKDFDVSNVRDALSAFNRLISPAHKKVYEGIFDTLQTGLSKLGESASSQTKAVSDLIQLIKDIPMDGKQDYDVLGFIYEYLISMFAANAGKKAGEFYTPHEVSLLMSEIVADHLKDKKEIQIYDPTSGSGSLLINIGRSISKHIENANNIKYFAQELKKNTYNLTRMNLVMRGILPDNIVTRNGDTLEDDWPFFDENDPINSYNPLYVDAVVSNPPYSQNWDSSNKEADPRYARFGLAPKSKADYAFLLHDLFHIKPDGIMTIILPHGVLFRGGEEGGIRRNLIEGNHIDTVIGLPANIFFGTSIPTIIMILKQKRDNTDVLIVDASKGFIKEGKNNKLSASDIKKIVNTVINRQDIFNYSRIVSREEIRSNDYNLNIPRYIDSSKNSESYDIYASMFGGIPKKEIDELSDYWEAFPLLRKVLFNEKADKYYELKTSDIKSAIMENSDIKDFFKNFSSSFDNFASFLKTQLIDNLEDVNISKKESFLTLDIFKRLENIPLIDKYEAYQLLYNEWLQISIDLEIIQTEGFASTKKVDPNMISKKKDGKDQEVQEGWIGHVIPFDLVQKTLLNDILEDLNKKQIRLDEITTEIEEIIESFTEEDKASEVFNETNDGFVNSALTKEYKSILKATNNGLTLEVDSYEENIVKAGNLLIEEKELKKLVKSDVAKLHQLTKVSIEKLSDEQVLDLLYLKWISPLVSSLNILPHVVVDEITSKVISISEKYKTTFLDIEEQIRETETILSSYITDLVGDEFDMKGLSEFQMLLNGE